MSPQQSDRVSRVKAALSERHTVALTIWAEARGEFVAHWDDDDWMAPGRLTYQVGSLLRSGAELCGVEQMLYWDPLNGQGWRYVYPAGEPRWVAGGSFLYRHATWERQPFEDINVDPGEFCKYFAAKPEQTRLERSDRGDEVNLASPTNPLPHASCYESD